MKEFEYQSKGAGMIHAYRWEPEVEPIAVVQLVHGIAEYMPRYDDFARFLTSKGALVVAEDHMGHGKSHGSGADLYFAGGWEAALEDTYTLQRTVREEYPDLPFFLFGHSMGSFMARSMLYRYPDANLSGAIICGTAWQPGAVLTAGRTVCAMECKRLGEKNVSKLVTNLMFGAYNKKFGKTPRTPNDWICSKEEVVDRYTADPLCGGAPTLGLARDMLAGIAMNQKKKNLDAMPKDLPVLLIAGKSDPVGAMGKGVEKTYKKFLGAGMRNVTLKLYDGRHEILNEDNHAEVYGDIWNFIEKSL